MLTKGARPEATDPTDPKSQDRAKMEKSAATSEGRDSKSQDADGQDSRDRFDADAGRRFLRDLGIDQADFYAGFAMQLAMANSDGQHCDEINSKFDLAFVRGVKPRDQVETVAAMQMAIAHRLAIGCARRFSSGVPLPELEIYERMFTRLVRTYLAGMEGLQVLPQRQQSWSDSSECFGPGSRPGCCGWQNHAARPACA